MNGPTDADSLLLKAAHALAESLAEAQARIVFSESCTAGLVAATLGSVPGISEHLCGSAVTYRNDTKIQWLGVTANAIAHASPVSSVVARQMAAGVLENTPEAHVAISITGHLGPGAPDDIDGVVFVGVAARGMESTAEQHRLPDVGRAQRQQLAAVRVLETAAEFLRRAEGIC